MGDILRGFIDMTKDMVVWAIETYNSISPNLYEFGRMLAVLVLVLIIATILYYPFGKE